MKRKDNGCVFWACGCGFSCSIIHDPIGPCIECLLVRVVMLSHMFSSKSRNRTMDYLCLLNVDKYKCLHRNTVRSTYEYSKTLISTPFMLSVNIDMNSRRRNEDNKRKVLVNIFFVKESLFYDSCNVLSYGESYWPHCAVKCQQVAWIWRS